MSDLIDFSVITESRQLSEMAAHYKNKPAFAFDVETTGDTRLDCTRNTVTWISFATDDRCDTIPIQHPNGELLSVEYPLLKVGASRKAAGLPLRPSDYSRDDKKAIRHFSAPPPQLYHAEVFDALRPVFNGDALKIGHNLKFDLKSVTKYNRSVPTGRYFDTMIASWLLDSRRTGQLGLAACLQRELGQELEKGIGAFVENHGFVEVGKYSALDSYWDYRLADKLIPQLLADGLGRLMRLEMDVLGALCHMELTGAPIDVEALTELHASLEAELEEATGQIYKLAGRAFNLNSNTEKQALLFTPKKDGGRGLRARKKTASGAPSVAADALEPFRGKDEMVDAMLHYADLNKLMSTYVIPYLGGTVERTTAGKTKTTERASLLVKGRIHTNFKQNGAETGRFSSTEPNLQNVPNASTPHGKAIRNLFCAPPGELLVCADYSQIEPRVIADFSKDPILLNAYLTDKDVYTAMVEGDILKSYGLNRAAGKLAVLAMSYGVGPDKVEQQLHLPPGKGKELLQAFEKQFAKVYRYKRQVIAEAANQRPTPFVSTILGRRRYLPDLKSTEFGLRARAERQAFNCRIQGSAADIMKVAIVRAQALLPDEAKLMLTVHDELLTSCPEDMAEEVAEIIKEAMEGIDILSIPLVAEVKIAKTWGEAK
jgi:DNA polymerase-1